VDHPTRREKSVNYYLVLDTETGGLNPKENPVLEMAAGVYAEDGSEKDSLHLTFKPYLPMDCKALAINGYFSRESGEGNNEYEIQKLIRWSTQAQSKYQPILVGQNLKFDLEFMDSLTSYYGFSGWSKMWNYHTLDTSQIAFILKEAGILNTERFNLAALAKAYGVENKNAHTAMSDVKTTATIFFLMLKQIRQLGDGKHSNSQ
jgi:DNA polymerase III alpha subunit (gram-positive type)